MSHEQYLLNLLNSSSKNTFDLKVWETLVLHDAITAGLIKEKHSAIAFGDGESTTKEILLVFSIILICVLSCLFLFLYYPQYSFAFLGLFPTVIFIFNYLETKSTFLFSRTKKVKEDYKKWLGLKAFLEDYSVIDTRTHINEIKIWEYYLVYAISLNLNRKALDFIHKNSNLKFYDLNRFINIFSYSKFFF